MTRQESKIGDFDHETRFLPLTSMFQFTRSGLLVNYLRNLYTRYCYHDIYFM
jgi:hypothetical protein